MNQQTNETIDSRLTEEATELASVQVLDLAITKIAADEIIGGAICHGVSVLAWARVDGVNHNETMEEDNANEREFGDLQLTEAQESDVKAGTAFVGGWGSSMYQYAYNDPNGTRPPAAGTLIHS